MLKYPLLAMVEVWLCTKSIKLNWLQNARSNLAPPSVPSVLTFQLYALLLFAIESKDPNALAKESFIYANPDLPELGVLSISVPSEFI